MADDHRFDAGGKGSGDSVVDDGGDAGLAEVLEDIMCGEGDGLGADARDTIESAEKAENEGPVFDASANYGLVHGGAGVGFSDAKRFGRLDNDLTSKLALGVVRDLSADDDPGSPIDSEHRNLAVLTT
jgi:hypothetical protein